MNVIGLALAMWAAETLARDACVLADRRRSNRT